MFDPKEKLLSTGMIIFCLELDQTPIDSFSFLGRVILKILDIVLLIDGGPKSPKSPNRARLPLLPHCQTLPEPHHQSTNRHQDTMSDNSPNPRMWPTNMFSSSQFRQRTLDCPETPERRMFAGGR